MSQEVHSIELGIKLEAAQQQLAIIALENAEYKKEIDELKQQNEELRKENGCFLESAQREQQTVCYLQSISADIDAVNVYNANLNTKIAQYQASLKILTSNNEYLQKENAKYQENLERFIQKTQRKRAIYLENTAALETKVRELEMECETLRADQVNTLSVLQTQTVSDSGSDEKQFESEDKIGLLRIKLTPYASVHHNSDSNHHNPLQKMARSPSGLHSDCDMDFEMRTPIIMENDACNNNDDEGRTPFTPMNTQFGYTDDIIMHMEARNELHVPMDSSRAMVGKLKDMNRKKESKIQKLMKQIKLLQKRNDALKKRNNKSCMTWVWAK